MSRFSDDYLRQFHSTDHASTWGVTPEQWNDSGWQLKNRINSLEQLSAHLQLSEREITGIKLAGTKLAMSITPYFLSLLDKNDPNCPLRRQVIPHQAEGLRDQFEMADPCGEDNSMPVPGLVHRYPDRVLFLVTDRCASYCRYCTRSRVVSGVGEQHLVTQWEQAFEYLQNHTEVRDVLLSGGDPLLLSDNKLEYILKRLSAIPHIEFLRIGSRIPIFLPQRITPQLAAMLRRYAPLFVSIHVNHPLELTSEVKQALDTLVDHGIVVGNQSVLLKGINDDSHTQKLLLQKLLRCRVRPYYLYQCDLIHGSAHFRTSISHGQQIMQELRGHTSGYAIPTYVVDGPGGGGKIPLNPQYLQQRDESGYWLKNYAGKAYHYPQPDNAIDAG